MAEQHDAERPSERLRNLNRPASKSTRQRWGNAAIYMTPIMVLAIAVNIGSSPTWLWVLPIVCFLVALTCSIGVRFAKTMKQAIWLTIGQMIFVLGSFALLAVPIMQG